MAVLAPPQCTSVHTVSHTSQDPIPPPNPKFSRFCSQCPSSAMDCPGLPTCHYHPATSSSTLAHWSNRLLPSGSITMRSPSAFTLHCALSIFTNIFTPFSLHIDWQHHLPKVSPSQFWHLRVMNWGGYAWLNHHNTSIPICICSSSIALHLFSIYSSFSLWAVWQPNGNIPLSAVSCLIWVIQVGQIIPSGSQNSRNTILYVYIDCNSLNLF